MIYRFQDEDEVDEVFFSFHLALGERESKSGHVSFLLFFFSPSSVRIRVGEKKWDRTRLSEIGILEEGLTARMTGAV